MSGLLTPLFLVLLCVQCFGKLHNYDDFDMEALLLNSTRSAAFFKCVRDETKCVNQEDKDMKDDIFEMVTTSCKGCTPKEKKKFEEAMTALERSMGDSQIITMFINQMTNMFQSGLIIPDTDKNIKEAAKLPIVKVLNHNSSPKKKELFKEYNKKSSALDHAEV